MNSGKKSQTGKTVPKREREELASLYRKVYDKCMEGEVKTFDAKGALSALEGLGKVRGLDAPDSGANNVILTLSDKVGDRGD